MSNLIEIEARHLKWCPYGFELYDSEVDRHYFSHFEDGVTVLHDIFGVEIHFLQDKILVNPEEYTKAVVDSIKEMIVLPKGFKYRINKDEGGPISVQFFYENTWVDHFLVAVDIAPWLDHYEYTLGVE